MATCKMGQLYTGMAYGNRWNHTWAHTWGVVAKLAGPLTVNLIPQDLFDDSLALVFWTVITDNFGGKLPTTIAEICVVPPEPTRSWEELAAAYKELRNHRIKVDDNETRTANTPSNNG